MPRGRRRKDPDDAPIDGDFSKDVVLNKQKGWTYKLLAADDIPYFRGHGFVREERSGADAARPAFDLGAASDTADFQVGGLTLYKAPDAVAQRLDRVAQHRADLNMSTIRDEAHASGGEFTTQLHR